MRRWLKLAFIVAAVGRSAVITFAAEASFTFDQPPVTAADGVVMWNQSAANARTSDRAQEGDASQQGVPPPRTSMAGYSTVPACSEKIRLNCVSSDGTLYYSDDNSTTQTRKDFLPVPEVIAEFVPLRLASTEASAGPAKDRAAGVWSVYLCSNAPVRVIVQRARVYMASPHIIPIPDGQAAALFAKRNQASPWRILGGFVKDYGALGAAAAGIAFSGLTAGAGAGVGAQLITKAISSAGQAANERTPEYKLYAPLPLQIVLEPGGCAEFDMLSALVPKAHRHQGTVQ